MEIGTADIEMEDGLLTPTRVDGDAAQGKGEVGNLDPGEVSRMLGRSLNGMAWDTVGAGLPGLGSTSGLSRLASEFALLAPSNSEGTPLTPQSLTNISSSLAAYTSVAGSSAYLDGLVGQKNVSAVSLRDVQRLVCSWPQWGASFGLVTIIALLLGTLVALDHAKKGTVIPLTLATVAGVLGIEYQEGVLDRNEADQGHESEFDSEELYRKYTR